MEFVLGITDRSPSTWNIVEQLWQDEQIMATSSHTVLELMSQICDTAIQNRREHDHDHGIHDHLWNLKITTKEAILAGSSRRRSLGQEFGNDSFSDEEDSDKDDDDSPTYRRAVLIQCPQEESDHCNEDLEEEVIFCHEKLSTEWLPQGSVMTVTYDYGSTTTLFLKVVKTRPTAVQRGLQYLTSSEEATNNNPSKQEEDMKAVPAHKLPKDQQIDTHFPHLSNIVVGKYVPVLQRKQGSMEDPHDSSGSRIGSIGFGKSACVRDEKNAPFLFMEGRTLCNDVLFCPTVIEPNELLQVAEQAWTPRDPDHDPDKLKQYRFDGIVRLLAPSDDDELYQMLEENQRHDYGFESKALIYRLSSSPSSSSRNISNKSASFDFQAVFPKTYGMLTNQKFRWFQYKKGVLHVICGRGVGHKHRDFEHKQVLKRWKYKFESFHELLCAVEASWIWNGTELTADMFLPQFDSDLGPSHPGPTQPFSLGTTEKCVMISQPCNQLKKLVTALAITEDKEGKTILYSGHDDGTLAKWSLEDNIQLWSKQIYIDGTNDSCRSPSVWGVNDTMGVAGIVIRPVGKSKTNHCIYTWTHAYEGYPDKDFEDREASKVKCWQSDGTYKRSYSCDVGDADDGTVAHPSIAAVVFCDLFMEDRNMWVDSMVVGLHCASNSLDWEGDYSQFDLDDAQESGEGNILPFYEHSNGKRMETWRDSLGLISSLAVIPQKYVLSFSIQLGHGSSDAMVLWSCEEPGVPLCRHDFWDPSIRNPLKQSLSRLYGVAGISVWGTDIIMADNEGDRIAAVVVEDEEGNPCLGLKGYASIGNKCREDGGFHGRMAMSGPHAIVANQSFPDVWMFHTQECRDHPKLDGRDGNEHKFYAEEQRSSEEGNPRKYAGREIAVGHISFPLWGGNKPNRKKRKNPPYMIGFLERDDDADGFGEGGPIVLAIRGKWLVAGFSNGTIARAPYLPSQFLEQGDDSVSANHLASSSHLPSDVWFHPILECNGMHEDDEDDENE